MASNKLTQADKPETQYPKSNLEIFSSFEEENEATAKIAASRTPEENFRIALEMIRAMYKKELAEERSHFNITFTMIEDVPVT